MAGSSRKSRALALLLTGETVLSASRKAGVGERSIYRWLSEPAFRGELNTRQALIIEAAGASLVALAGEAVEALSIVLKHPGERGSNVKRLAALSILELILKFREELTFEERLRTLEEAIRHEK